MTTPLLGQGILDDADDEVAVAAALAEYRARHCRPGCPRCTSPEGILACSRDAAWTALARIKARLHDPA